jgi:hypothetical protein
MSRTAAEIRLHRFQSRTGVPSRQRPRKISVEGSGAPGASAPSRLAFSDSPKRSDHTGAAGRPMHPSGRSARGWAVTFRNGKRHRFGRAGGITPGRWADSSGFGIVSCRSRISRFPPTPRRGTRFVDKFGTGTPRGPPSALARNQASLRRRLTRWQPY